MWGSDYGPGAGEGTGVAVVTVNKPGANNQVALTNGHSKPDGYTIGSPVPGDGYELSESGAKAAYNRKSFEPVVMHVKDVNLWAVRSTSPYKP